MPPTGPSLPRGRVTFCFTDVEGSTRLFHRLGDAWPPLLAQHDAIVRTAAAANGGVEVKTEGDAFFLAFGDATAALTACADVQRALASHTWPPGVRVRVRMALHTAEVEPVGDDYVSIDVHRVARIIGAAHGGQVLTSAETAAEIDAAAGEGLGLNGLRELGAYRLKDFDLPQRLFQLVGPGLGDEFPQLRVPPASRHNLPRQRTSFVGREEQLAQLVDLVPRTPLTTLLAAGGVGKTRLAVEVATRLVPVHDDGVWFVDLAALTDPTLVASAVATVLGIVEVPLVPVGRSVVEHLADRAALLVLDNCEQVVDGVAELVDAVLAEAPGVRVLATSREALEVRGEQRWPLAPLAQPDPSQPSSVATSESGRLFVERARMVAPSFALTDADAGPLALLLRGLDGIPLAIELAAARVATMAVVELVGQLDRQLDLLVGGARSDAPRQRTLRATIGWSYDLLSDDEQAVLARLSVFAGGFARDAAEEVAGYDGISPTTVAASVDALVARSLLEVDDGRFRFLVVVRDFAAEQLLEPEAADRHLAWVLGLLDLSDLATGTAAHADALDAFEREHDNVRAAYEHAVGTAAALRIATAAAEPRFLRGHVEEGRAAIRGALASGGDAATVARAQAALGYNLLQVDGVGEEEHALLEAAAGGPDGRASVTGLIGLAIEQRFQGSIDEAAAILDAAGRRAVELADERGEMSVLVQTAYVAVDRGRHADGIAAATRATHLAGALGDRRQTGIALHARSLNRWYAGDPSGCEQDAIDALTIFGLLGDLRSQALCEARLAWCEQGRGARAAAAAHIGHAVRLVREIRAAALLPELLEALAALEAPHRPDRAAALVGAAAAASAAAGFGADEELAATRAELRARLGETYDDLVAAGAVGRLDDWVELALDVAGSVPADGRLTAPSDSSTLRAPHPPTRADSQGTP